MSVLADFYNSKGIFLSQKVKNLIKKISPENNYVFNLKNIDVNGQKRGCSGFITNPDTGNVVYLTTEYCQAGHFMYRYAENDHDYRGRTNRWDGRNDFSVFGKKLVEALNQADKRLMY